MDGMVDSNTWTSVSRYWYSKALDKSPTFGHLLTAWQFYVAQSSALKQLYFHAKLLYVPPSFPSSR